MIGLMNRDEALEEGRGAVADGCTALQIKGTGELDRDVEVITSLRQGVGEEISLRFDANQSYRGINSKEAARAIRLLSDAGIDLLEQPGEGLREMAMYRALSTIPVVADESCWQPTDVIELAEASAADAISIYVAKAGGLSRARTIGTLAQIYGFACDVNGSLETGIGSAASAHLAVATPAVTLPCVIPVSAPAGTVTTVIAGRYFSDDVITEPFTFQGGLLLPPEGPGLGVHLDDEKLAAYTAELSDRSSR
jgi:L-alanine-DL-glutamate epimerase-like enolase superfamily enzyme